MSDAARDRALGMDRKITRRDFLDGVAIAVGGSVLASSAPWLRGLESPDSSFAPEKDPNYYPPALMGLRGNHEGTYTSAHSVRDGEFWDSAGKPESTDEKYDLVIVGAASAASLPLISIGNKWVRKRAFLFSTTTTISADTPSAMNFAPATGCC